MKKDTLDIGGGSGKIGYVLMWIIMAFLFAALLVFLIGRRNEINNAKVLSEQNAELSQQTQSSEPLSEEAHQANTVGDEQAGAENGVETEDSLGEETVVTSEKELPVNTYSLLDKETVMFTFAGDVLLDESYAIMSTYRMNGSELDACIDPALLEMMRGADVFMLNNEFPFTERGEARAGKAFTFRANPENVQILHDMGVDIVSLANNHIYDYGEEGLLDTLDTLEGAGIPYVGAGRNLEEASKVVYFQNDDMKIGIISATEIERYATPDTKGATEDSPGAFRCFRNDLLEDAIREAKKECDFLILFVHWGTESTDELDWSQPGQAKDFTEAGADVIIGAHPHVLQEVGNVNDTLVFYSLGNYWFSSKTLDSCLVTLEIGKDGLVSAQFIPCTASGGKTNLATGNERERILAYMRRISDTVVIDENGYVELP